MGHCGRCVIALIVCRQRCGITGESHPQDPLRDCNIYFSKEKKVPPLLKIRFFTLLCRILDTLNDEEECVIMKSSILLMHVVSPVVFIDAF